MRTATLDKVCKVTDIPFAFATLTYVAVNLLCQPWERLYEQRG